MNQTKDVVIAYLPNQRDFQIALKEKWYRIPVSSKNTPNIIKDKSVKIIAFYLPHVFGLDAFVVRYFGIVKSIITTKGKYLFKYNPINEKAEKEYFKISFEKLLQLPQPIASLRHRRILFITTTFNRFDKAQEINDLFLESPLEEKFWMLLRKNSISAERQYLETINKKNFILDFAVFCKKSKLAIECDGDTYHDTKEAVHSDKNRDNKLENIGWNVFRYTTNDIENDSDRTILQVRDTINRYGGQEDPLDNSKFVFFPKPNQDSLFE